MECESQAATQENPCSANIQIRLSRLLTGRWLFGWEPKHFEKSQRPPELNEDADYDGNGRITKKDERI